MNKELSDLKNFLKISGFSSEYNYLDKISQDLGSQLSPYMTTYNPYDKYWRSKEGQIKRLEYLINTDNRVADAFGQAADDCLELISNFIMKEIKENMRSLYSYVSSKTVSLKGGSLSVGIRKYALMNILKKYSEDSENVKEKFDYAPLVGVASSFYKNYIGYLSLMLGSFVGIFTSEGVIGKAISAAKLFVLFNIFENMDLGEGYMSVIHLLTGGVFTETFNNLLAASGMALISKAITELQYLKASNIKDEKERFEYVNNMWDTKFKSKEETKEISEGLRSREGFLLRTKNALEESWNWLKDNTKSKDETPLLENIDFGKYIKKFMKKPMPSEDKKEETNYTDVKEALNRVNEILMNPELQPSSDSQIRQVVEKNANNFTKTFNQDSSTWTIDDLLVMFFSFKGMQMGVFSEIVNDYLLFGFVEDTAEKFNVKTFDELWERMKEDPKGYGSWIVEAVFAVAGGKIADGILKKIPALKDFITGNKERFELFLNTYFKGGSSGTAKKIGEATKKSFDEVAKLDKANEVVTIRKKIKAEYKVTIDLDETNVKDMNKIKDFLEKANELPGVKIDIERMQRYLDIDTLKRLDTDSTNVLEQSGENILNNINNIKIPE